MRPATPKAQQLSSDPGLNAGSGCHPRTIGTAAAFLVCLLAAGCGNGGTTTGPTVTQTPALPAVPSVAATSAPAAGGATAAAVAAYRGFWDDAVYANAHAGYWNATARASLGTGGSLSTLFAKHAVGGAFEQQRVAIYRADRNGDFSQGSPTLHPRVLSSSPPAVPTEVRLADCLDATNWLVHRRPGGELKDNRPGQKHPLQATVVYSTSGWRVRDLTNPPGKATC